MIPPLCGWCEEPLIDGSNALVMPFVRMHRECAIRMVAGSVAHLERRCSCYGGPDEDDEEGLSKREAARRAMAAAIKLRPRLLGPGARRGPPWTSN